MSNKKVYLNCPYDNKDECKALGGRWDPDKRMWYVPTGYALDPFRPWWPKDVSEQVKNTFGSIDHPIVEE